MDIYATREELKLRQKSIFDLELKVAYYARVSTDKEEQKTSIEHQWTFFEQLISGVKNWKFIDGYIDEGISGITVTHREEFQRMLQDAKDGKIDLIITKEITRFARNVLDSIRYTRELLDCGTAVWFQNDNINTLDEDSELRLSIMSGIAQEESRKLSSRVRFGHARSIQNGVVLGNSHIYGWDKRNGKLFLNPEEAKGVRERLDCIPHLNISSSYEDNIEITCDDYDKGIMLREVLKLKGLNLDEVATFGDGLNDVCMLKGFPYSFTPANGCKEAKEAATYTLTKTGGNGAIQEGLHILKDLDLI